MAEPMNSKEAIAYIVDMFAIQSMYALAQSLSDEELTIQPIQISNWKDGGKMSPKAAKRFSDVYDVIIHSDSIHSAGMFVRDKQ